MLMFGKRFGVALAGVVAVLSLVVGVTGVGVASAAPASAGGVLTLVQSGSTATVAVDGLRLRSKPGYGGYVKGLLYRGDKVFVRGTWADSEPEAPWVEVVLKKRSRGGLPYLTRGYVYRAYLR